MSSLERAIEFYDKFPEEIEEMDALLSQLIFNDE